MAKYDFDDEDGVWRTVGGRRIFIREGESLSSAMKNSGKFKSAKRNIKGPNSKEIKEINKKVDEEFGTEEKAKQYEQDKGLRDLIKDKDALNERLLEMKKSGEYKELLGDNDEKSMKEAEDRIKQDRESAKENDSKQLKEKIGNDVKKLQDEAHKRGMLPSELQDQLGIKDSDLGLKDDYTEKFEQEMQGMERYLKAEEAKRTSNKTYKSSELEKGKPYNIDMGNGIEKTAIYIGKDENGNNSFYDGEGVSGTFGFSDKFVNERLKISDGKDDDKFIKLHNQIKNETSNGSDKTNDIEKMLKRGNTYIPVRKGETVKEAVDNYAKTSQARETQNSASAERRQNLINYTQNNKDQIKKWVDEYDAKTNKEAFEKAKQGKGLTAKEYFGFLGGQPKEGDIVDDKRVGKGGKLESISRSEYKTLPNGDRYYVGKAGTDDYYEKVMSQHEGEFKPKSSNTAYQKAFNEYKKQHPNTKLTLSKFIDISEGR